MGMTAVISFVQRWTIVAAVVVAVLAVLKIAHLEAELAETNLNYVTEKAARESAARAHEAKLAKREQEHATAQQEKDDAYNQDKQTFEKRMASERVATDGLRKQLASATARANAGSATDPVACERAFYRHEELGELAGEGAGLLQEARELLQERDRDIKRLWDQLTIDRKAIGQPV